VFAVADLEFSVDEKVGSYFKAVDTVYGRGCKLIKLDGAGLASCKPDSEGLINIIVGIAFRNNALTDNEPFSANLNKKEKINANKVSSAFKQAGYDCVQIKGNVDEKVYWVPGACIPLGLVTMRFHKQCIICLDNCLGKDGYACSNKHFLCWECLEYQLKDAFQPGHVGKTMNQDGVLICSDTECTEFISLQNMARESTPAKVIELIDELKSSFKIKKAVEAALKDQERRLTKEFERIMAIKDIGEREVERIRLSIIEEILTLKCPRCKVAFIDYSGSAALTCANNGCRAGFCACCLMDCGVNSSYAHLVGCPSNPTRAMYITLDAFNKLHCERRKQLIVERLRKETREVQQRLLISMKREFQDLGIQINI
jgi:hypothetical protein